jgi:uncharacterized protein
MLGNELTGSSKSLPPFISVVLILLIASLGFVIGGIIPLYLYLPFYSGNEQELMEELGKADSPTKMKYLLYAVQAGASIGGLFLAPFLFLRLQQKSLTTLFSGVRTPVLPIIVTAVIVVTFMGMNSFFVEWNQGIHLPEFLREFENWARKYEEAAAKQTEALTKMDSVSDLMIAIVVIAILPGIGEEIVFRGLIQNELYRGTRNIHLSIWVAAILFSAIHFQFFGFVPRLLLGALFGYLYYWSGNLTLAMLAHFVNNAVSVIAVYFYQRGAFDYDLERPQSAPANLVITSVLLTAGLLYYFYKYFENRKPVVPLS